MRIMASKTYSLGFGVTLEFKITQHVRDENLIRNFIDYFGCGRVELRNNAVDFKVTRLKDIADKVIPLFLNYPIGGLKFKDFADFSMVAKMMQEKRHLTKKGLERIKKIKAGMNTGRK